MKRSVLRMFCENSSCPLAGREDFIPCELNKENYDKKSLDVLFVGEAPGPTEVKRGLPFIGRSGQLLRRIVRNAKVGKVNVGYTNVGRCMPTDDEGEVRPPSAKEARCCRGFLDRDIAVTDPDIIVLLGKSPLDAFPPGGSYTITGERGNWRIETIAGRERVIFSTWHPAYVGRQKKMLPIFYEDIRKIFRMARGWRPKPEWSEMGTSRLLKTVREVQEYTDHLRRDLTKDDFVAVDVETKNVNKRHGNQIGLIQFATDIHSAVCIPLDHPKTPFDAEELLVVKALLRRLFTKKVSFGYWLAHSGKFEQTLIGGHILMREDRVQRTFRNVPMIDTLAFAYLLNENLTNLDGERSYRLKLLVKQVLGFHHYDETTLAARSGGSLFDLPLESLGSEWVPNLTDYGGMDAYVTLRLFHALREEAIEENYFEKVMALLTYLFSPVYRLLSAIERNGFWANLAHMHMLRDPDRSPILTRLSEIDRVDIHQFETAKKANAVLLKQRSGGHQPMFGDSWVLDLGKPDHQREWLINQCGFEAPDKTPTTELPSMGKTFFQEHRGLPESDLLEERKGLVQLKGLYINQLIEYLDPSSGHESSKDGRIRADIHFASTVTGRGSSSNPNMQQQVRADSPAKAAIKSIFQAEQPGMQTSFKVDFKKGLKEAQRPYAPVKRKNAIVQLDFMTNEVRWWCILSGCPDLAKALINGKAMRDAYRADPLNAELRAKAKFEGDLHRNTASLMYSIAVSEVEKDKRNAAKSIVFGWMFGRGVAAIAAQIGKTKAETEKLITQFGDSFPAGRDWLHGQPDVAREHLYTESPLGRRRRLPGLILNWDDWENRKLIGESERMAKNSGIQGIASDAAFIGATLFLDYIEDHGKSDWMIQNVVHDSCVYQVPIAELEESVQVAEELFTTGTMNYITEHWGLEFTCPIEVDFEMGPDWGKFMKWDGTQPEMDRIIAALDVDMPEPEAISPSLPTKVAKVEKQKLESHKLF